MVELPVNLESANDNARELADLVEKVFDANNHSWGTFDDCLALWDCTLHRFQPGMEARYMETVGHMQPEAVRLAAQGFGLLMSHFCLEGCYADILGVTYMDLAGRWKRAALGQYFTPWTIALMMAEMVTHDHDWKANEPLSCNEPCVGSGVMLLAFRGIVARDHGRTTANRLQLSGQDIDQMCVKMARIQTTMTNDRYMSDLMAASLTEYTL